MRITDEEAVLLWRYFDASVLWARGINPTDGMTPEFFAMRDRISAVARKAMKSGVSVELWNPED